MYSTHLHVYVVDQETMGSYRINAAMSCDPKETGSPAATQYLWVQYREDGTNTEEEARAAWLYDVVQGYRCENAECAVRSAYA